MQVLLSSIGSRGDVQPLVALALELRALGQQARLCVAPNFRPWVESFGLPCIPIGPDLRQLTVASTRSQQAKPSAEQLRQLASHTVRAQFPVLVEAARASGLRTIISRGWGNVVPVETGADCLEVDDLPHQKLFARVAAVVHHGGAGTTVTAALMGCPQVIAPHIYDQYYWGSRVERLGIGIIGPNREMLNVDALGGALREVLGLRCVERAQRQAGSVARDGARVAAEGLVWEFGR